VDLTYKQEVGVGALVLAGVAVFLVGMFWLTGRSLRTTGISVDVTFESVAGLKQGDPVLVSGVKKGRVARVHLERVMQRVDSMLGSGTGASIDSISRNLARLTNHLSHTTAQVDTLLSRINRGEGTLGKMASDSTMYHDLHELSRSLTALLTDLKEHPDKYMKPGLVRVKLF